MDPLPSSNPLDLLNWSLLKKKYEIFLISFHSFIVTFMAAGSAPAYEPMSLKYGKTITEIPNLKSVQNLVVGIFPLVFVPLMNIYGGRLF